MHLAILQSLFFTLATCATFSADERKPSKDNGGNVRESAKEFLNNNEKKPWHLDPSEIKTISQLNALKKLDKPNQNDQPYSKEQMEEIAKGLADSSPASAPEDSENQERR